MKTTVLGYFQFSSAEEPMCRLCSGFLVGLAQTQAYSDSWEPKTRSHSQQLSCSPSDSMDSDRSLISENDTTLGASFLFIATLIFLFVYILTLCWYYFNVLKEHFSMRINNIFRQ